MRRTIPKEKLFFINVKDGWEPLCQALDLPVPDEPFPRANDAAAADQVFKSVILKAGLRWMVLLSVFGIGTWQLWAKMH